MAEGVTLVLGGLGVKGVAHIGTLQALGQHRLRIKRIVATGISSLVAAQFALGRDPDSGTERFVRFFTENHRYLWGLERLAGLLQSKPQRAARSFSYFLRERLFCRANLNRLSILPWELVETDLEEFFGGIKNSQLAVPVVVSAIDLRRGREVLLEQGSLINRLKASIAFPGLFPPVHIGKRELVSSTLYCELPLGSLGREHAPILAVDIPTERQAHRPDSIIEMVAQIDEIRSAAVKRILLARADRVFRLEGLKKFQWGTYKHIPQLVSQARQEMASLLNSSADLWDI